MAESQTGLQAEPQNKVHVPLGSAELGSLPRGIEEQKRSPVPCGQLAPRDKREALSPVDSSQTHQSEKLLCLLWGRRVKGAREPRVILTKAQGRRRLALPQNTLHTNGAARETSGLWGGQWIQCWLRGTQVLCDWWVEVCFAVGCRSPRVEASLSLASK